MEQYFFILGRDPVLSIAEIFSVFSSWEFNFQTITVSKEVLILSSNNNLDVEKLNRTLGGTVKIGIILDEVGLNESEEKFIKIFSADNLIENYLPKTKKKLHLGISLYHTDSEGEYLKTLYANLKSFNMLAKKNLTKQGKKVGFVKVKERFLKSVSVAKNKLLEEGVEIVLILTKKNILMGKTCSVQDFEGFSFRDIGRPQKDKRSGIIPPKLARIMINVSQIKKDQLLLDPFCGSGTILQEAVILGIKNIIGADISNKAIVNTHENLNWLFREFKYLNKSTFSVKLLQTDVAKLESKLKSGTIDAVVTEPYLGPPFTKHLTKEEVKTTFSQVKSLYFDAFSQFNKLLKPDGVVVIIFPVFEINGKNNFLDILGELRKIGFSVKNLVSDKRLTRFYSLTNRGSIVVGEKGKFVKREIIFFQMED